MSEKQSFERIDLEEESVGSSQTKRDFIEPKLRFIEPKLIKHSDVTEITGQFIGPFSPP